MDIVFYNEHQHGDLILGRQNVRWIVDNSPDYINFYYLHNKDPKSIFVHERIQHISINFNFHAVPMVNIENYVKKSGNFTDALWVSTWLGSINNMQKLIDERGWERYLLPNEKNTFVIGENEDLWDNMKTQLILCKQNIDTINDFLTLNFKSYKLPYPQNSDQMLVKWNSNPKNIEQIKSVIKNGYKLKVLVCNGDVLSNERKNFDYGEYLKEIIETNTDTLFYFTQNVSLNLPNVININEVVPIPNLDEIEYLSAFCDIIITSLSGPGCSVVNDAVVKDPNKTLIHVCRSIIGLVYDKHLCKCIQTEDYSYENITKIINKAILEKK